MQRRSYPLHVIANADHAGCYFAIIFRDAEHIPGVGPTIIKADAIVRGIVEALGKLHIQNAVWCHAPVVAGTERRIYCVSDQLEQSLLPEPRNSVLTAAEMIEDLVAKAEQHASVCLEAEESNIRSLIPLKCHRKLLGRLARLRHSGATLVASTGPSGRRVLPLPESAWLASNGTRPPLDLQQAPIAGVQIADRGPYHTIYLRDVEVLAKITEQTARKLVATPHTLSGRLVSQGGRYVLDTSAADPFTPEPVQSDLTQVAS